MIMEKILYINACTRKLSRTDELASTLLNKLDGMVEEIRLYEESIKPLDETALEKRDALIKNGEFSHSCFAYARAFADADTIVISAPYWDLLFPAVLRTYLENITVPHITFRYSAEGIPQGLCKAKTLYYVVTAGGFIGDNNFGFDYIKTLAGAMFGIKDIICIKAEGLDIDGADTEAIMKKAKDDIVKTTLLQP